MSRANTSSLAGRRASAWRQRWRWETPPALWAGLIAGLSSLSLPDTPPLFPFQDKVVHAILYGVLAALCARALRQGVGWSPRAALVGGWVIAAAYGVTDELHQLWVPLRSADPADWLADAVGAAIGLAALRRTAPEYRDHETAGG